MKGCALGVHYCHGRLHDGLIRGENDFSHMTPRQFEVYVRIHEDDSAGLEQAWDYFANTADSGFAESVLAEMNKDRDETRA